MIYTYRIVKENFINGQRADRARSITRYEPLEVGGLYLHLGHGYPGAYRVLELVKTEKDD